MGCWQNCTSNQATIRSLHPSGANVALGDGSVRYIKNSITQKTFYQIGSAQDGVPIATDF